MKLSARSYFLATSLASQGVRIISSLLLFRMLSASDYGAAGLVAIFPGFIGSIGDLGAMRSVYVLDGREPNARGTCLLITLATGVVLSLAWLGAGFYLAAQQSNPTFALLGAAGALNVPLNYLFEYAMILLNLEKNFSFEANARLVRALVAALSSLAFAAMGMGPLAILGSILLASVVAVTISFLAHRRLFAFDASLSTARKALHLGTRMTAAQYLNNMGGSIYSTMAAHAGGQVGLGLFGRATQVVDMFNHSFVNNLLRIFQPNLRPTGEDTTQLSSHFCRSCLVTAYLSVPVAIVLYLRSPELIRVLMGPGWTEVPDLLKPFAIAMALGATGGVSLATLQCAGRVSQWTLATLAALGTAATIFFLSGEKNLLATCNAVASAQVVSAIVLTVSAVVTLRLSVAQMIPHGITLPLSAGLAAICIGLLPPLSAPPLISDLYLLVTSGVISLTVIGATMALLHRSFFRLLVQRSLD